VPLHRFGKAKLSLTPVLSMSSSTKAVLGHRTPRRLVKLNCLFIKAVSSHRTQLRGV